MYRNIVCLVLFFSLHLLLFQSGCSDTTQCQQEDRISQLSVNPSGSPCNFNCDCNNQVYEGVCQDGKCLSFQRDNCSVPGQRQPCFPVVGECTGGSSGSQICKPDYLNASRWGDCECVQDAECSAEVCDGQDNDCDGLVDENLSRPCYEEDTGCRVEDDRYICEGQCQEGVESCFNGTWSSCRNKVYPSPEICDGKDNDCDGEIDEDNPDGGKRCTANEEGNCQRGETTCNNGLIECRSVVKPTTEVCNGQDDDCDGVIDEDITKECYAANTVGCSVNAKGEYLCKGVCQAGNSKCVLGMWGTCTNQVTPAEEEVCGNGKDDTCDGSVDEDCPCTDGTTQDCGTDTGECKKGLQTCTDEKWGSCEGQTAPVTEACNGLDDDCDGEVDEELKSDCYTGSTGCTKNTYGVFECKGACNAGTRSCVNGKLGACVNETTPTAETCNGKDDDCDGQIDDVVLNKNCTVQSAVGAQGECAKGSVVCENGKEVCKPSSPSGEVCDGKDNDCDGQVDESLTQDCYPSGAAGCTKQGSGFVCKGICKVGTQTCSAGKWGACSGPIQPEKESCNQRDDNCDGNVDENLTNCCQDGKKRACGSNVGVCSSGSQTCTGGKWGDCTGGVTPKSEICDGRDNNCDGQIDESLIKYCYTFSQGCTGTASAGYKCVGSCAQGKSTCISGKWSICSGQQGPAKESCDGKDNDCNGQIDDKIPSIPCTVKDKYGICADGKTTCSSGKTACTEVNRPGTEICDGKDNNCDGKTDETFKEQGLSCPTGKPGVCQKGKYTCPNGRLVCQPPAPTIEVCDGVDNDCDGQTDETFKGKGTVCDTKLLGICKNGALTCEKGNVVCRGIQPGTAKEVCDGKDNDCDGKVDNGLYLCRTGLTCKQGKCVF
ncbi:MAG TPA: hypothetical protein DCE42_25355 [Myxococcales bacterium]|nr:hypothetical protein [Myxococcales bacterium]